MMSQSSTSLAVPPDCAPSAPVTPLDIYDSVPDFSVTITALPAHGAVFLADGVTPVIEGQAVTLAQLSALTFDATLAGAAAGAR